MVRKAVNELGVKRNDVWKCGPHVLACADLGEGGPARLLKFVGEVPTLAYTDLPWSAPVAAEFRKKAGVETPLNFAVLVKGMLAGAIQATGDAFFEASALPKVDAQIRGIAIEAGAPVLEAWDTAWQQFTGRLFRVKGSTPLEVAPGPDGRYSGLAATCIETCTERGDLVMDCCMGYGLLALESAKRGRRALGTELNPDRVSGSLLRLMEAGEGEPHRIGVLP